MEYQKNVSYGKRYSIKKFLAYLLVSALLFGAMPVNMLTVSAAESQVSSGDIELQNITEGGEVQNKNGGISMISDEELTTVTITSTDDEITWNGTSPRTFSIYDLFTVSGTSLANLQYEDDYTTEVVWEETTPGMFADDKQPTYDTANRRWNIAPIASGTVTFNLTVKESELLGIAGASANVKVTVHKGDATEQSGAYYLSFSGYDSAQYSSSFNESDIKLYTNQNELCTDMDITFTYKNYYTGEVVEGFPTDIGKYTVIADVAESPLWLAFTVQKTFEIIPKQVRVNITASDYQYGLLDVSGNAQEISYTYTFANENDIKVEDREDFALSFSTDATSASEPDLYKIYAAGNNPNYKVVVNRNMETGIGYVRIVPRELTAEWSGGDYTLYHNGEYQSVHAVLQNVVDGDEEDVYLTYDGNMQYNPGSYTATVTGIAGDKSDCYVLTNPDITQNWSIEYGNLGDIAVGDASIVGKTVQALVGEEQWYSGDVSLVAPAGFEITLNPSYTDWADEIDLTGQLEEGTDNPFTYYLMQKETGIIVGQRTININYDITAPEDTILTFKGVVFDDFVENYTRKFFINKEATVDYDASAELTVSGSDLYRVEYVIADPTVNLTTLEAEYYESTPDYGSFWTVLYDKTANTTGSVASTFNVVPNTSYTNAGLASQVNCEQGEQVVYLKITDMAGNETIISTDVIVVYDDVKSAELEDGEYHDEYVMAEENSVEVALLPKTELPFETDDEYIASVTIKAADGSSSEYRLTAGTDYSYDASGNLNLASSAFNKVTEVEITEEYIVSVEIRPYGYTWCDKYNSESGTAANDEPATVEFLILAAKADSEVVPGEECRWDVVYDGAAFDDYEFSSTGDAGVPATLSYVLYDETIEDEYDLYTGWTSGTPTNVGNYILKVEYIFAPDSLYNNAKLYQELTIKKLDVSVNMTVADKDYDGTEDAEVTALTVDTGIGTSLRLDPATVLAEFADKNADSGITVTQTGFVDAQGNPTTKPGTLPGSDLLSNYNIVKFNDTTATVSPAKIDITLKPEAADDLEFIYGNDIELGSIGEEDVTVVGIADEESYTSIGIRYQVETAAKYTVGSYDVEADCTNTNYTVNSMTGTLKVVERPVEVTWDSGAGTLRYYTGTAHSIAGEFSNKVDGDDVTISYGGLTGTEIGAYKAKVTGISGVDSNNYTILDENDELLSGLSLDWKIERWVPEWVEDPEDGMRELEYGWYNFDDANEVSIDAPDNYKIRIYDVQGAGTGTWSDAVVIADGDYPDGENALYYQLKYDDGGYITEEGNITIKIDTEDPEGTITITDGSNSKSFTARIINAVLSLFYENQFEVTITATDATSGPSTIYYTTVAEPLGADTDFSAIEWEEYESTETIRNNQTVYVYAMLTDVAGNCTVINSNGVVIYTNPEYVGVNEEEIYDKYSGTDIVVDVNFYGNTVNSIQIEDVSGNVVATLDEDDYQANEAGNNVKIFANFLDTLSTAGTRDYTEYTIVVKVDPLGEGIPNEFTGVAPDAVEIPLTVNKAETVITVYDFEMYYNGEAVIVDEESGITYSTNHKEGEVETGLTATYYECKEDGTVGEALPGAPTDVGTYYVQLTIAATDNYKAATSEEALITIKRKPAKGFISISDKVYDGEDDATIADVTITTGVADETFVFDAVNSTATFSFEQAKTGTDLTVSIDDDADFSGLVFGGSGDLSNYDVEYTIGTADITKRTVYVYIEALEAVYGDGISVSSGDGEDALDITDVSAFYGTNCGLVGEDELTDVITLSYESNSIRHVGNHDISIDAFDFTSKNYEIALKDSKEAGAADADTVKLVVTPRPVTPKWMATNESRVFDKVGDGTFELIYNAKDYTVSVKEFENLIGDDEVTPNASGNLVKSATGTYTVTLGNLNNPDYMYAENQNSLSWEIMYLDEYFPNDFYDDITYTGTEGDDDWYRSSVVMKPYYSDCMIAIGANDNSAVWDESNTITAEGITTGYYAVRDINGYITSLRGFEVKIDKTAPKAEITVDYNGDSPSVFEQVLSTLSFGIFSTEDVTVTVSAGDVVPAGLTAEKVSGLADVFYMLVDSEDFDQNILSDEDEWDEYDGAITLSSESKNIVLVKVVDHAGNYEIFNADGIVVYTNSTSTIPTVDVSGGDDFEGYEMERVNADKLVIDITTYGNTVAGVTCDGDDLTDEQYGVVSTTNGITLTLYKSFMETLTADNGGMHDFVISFKPLDEEYVVGESLGEAPDTINFSVKMNKLPGVVELDENYAPVYNGKFVELPGFSEILSSGSPSYKWKKKGAISYGNSRPKDAGEYTVQVTIPEDDYYTAATDEMNFVVAQKPVEIVVPVEDKVYDGNEIAVAGTITVETGIAGESFTVTGTLDCEFEDENVGVEKVVTVTDDSRLDFAADNDSTKYSNYSFSYVAETASITARPVQLDVTYKSMVYGSEDIDTVSFGFTVEDPTLNGTGGLAQGDTVADLGDVVLVTDADSASDVDTYDVSLDEEASEINSNYEVYSVEGTDAFEITQLAIEVAWNTPLNLIYTAKEQEVTAKITNLVDGDDLELLYTGNAQTAVADDYVAVIDDISGGDVGNYMIPANLANDSTEWSIAYLTGTPEAVVKDLNGEVVTDWANTGVTIEAPGGYYISTQNTDAADTEWFDSIPYSIESATTAGRDFVYYLKSKANEETSGGYITDAMHATIKLDNTVPGVEISVREHSWLNEVIDSITFGIFYKGDAVVEVAARDSLSGVVKMEYLYAQSYEEYTELMGNEANWTVLAELEEGEAFVKETIDIVSDKVAVFVRVYDAAGNCMVYNSDGFVIYKDSVVETTSVEFIKATDDDVVIQAAMNNNEIASVVVDGEPIDDDCYEVVEDAAREGYHQITLKKSYLAGLDAKAEPYEVVISYKPHNVAFVPGVSEGEAPATSTVYLTVSKNPANTITAVADMSKVYDGLAVEPEVTTVDRYAGVVEVTYKVKDAATGYSPKAPTQAGEYTAKIVAKEDTSYFAKETTQNFVIREREIAVEIQHEEITYGDAIPVFTAPIADGYTLGEGDTYDDLGIDLAADVDASVAYVSAGTYDVEGTFDNANYKVNFNGGEDAFVVNKRPVKVVWSADELVYTAKEQGVSATVDNLVGQDACELTVVKNQYTKVNNYTAEVTLIGNPNYTDEGATGLTHDWSIVYHVATDDVILDGGTPVNGWYSQTVYVKAPKGYTISTQNTNADEGWEDSLEVSAEAENPVRYYLKSQAGLITDYTDIVVKVDKTEPNATILVKDNAFKNFVNDITFGLFFKKTVDVKIVPDNDLSGIAKVQYQVVKNGNSIVESDWKDGREFAIQENSASVIYAKLTDNAGNVKVVHSNGVVVYTDSAQDTEAVTYTLTSTDNITAKVTLNDNTIKGIKNGEYELTEADYSVSGNEITLFASYLGGLLADQYDLEVSYKPLDQEYVDVTGNDAPATTNIKLNVVKKSLAPEEMINISVTDLSKTYDGKAVTPSVTSLSTGTKTITYAVKGSDDFKAEAPVNVGTYVIKVHVDEDRYYVASERTAEFVISSRAITITADDQNVVSGTVVKADGYKVTTGTLAEGQEIESVKLTADTSKVTTDAKIVASEAIIKDSEGKDVTANYEVSYVEGNLVVTHNTELAPEKVTVEVTKTGYIKGEQIDVETIIVTAEYADGYKAEVTDYTTNIPEIDMNEVGIKPLKITYVENGKTLVAEVLLDVTSDQGSVGFEVIQGDDTPTIGVESDKDKLKDDVLTDEDEDDIANNISFNIYLEIQDINETISATDKQLINSVLNGATVGGYYDISLFKKIGEEPATSIDEIANSVKIGISVPEELRIGDDARFTRNFMLIYVENGVAQYLPVHYDMNKQTITFETNRFANYSLVYKDVDFENDDEEDDDDNITTGVITSPKTGDDGILVEFMMFILTLGVMLCVMKSYRRREE